jgi:hypothetical protein
MEEEFGVPHGGTFKILLRRGVFKWLAVRRDLIRLKNTWRARVTATIDEIRVTKRNIAGAYSRPILMDGIKRLYWLRGYLEALEDCRAEIRALCHSERWQAPDNDRHAVEWLERQEVTNEEERPHPNPPREL